MKQLMKRLVKYIISRLGYQLNSLDAFPTMTTNREKLQSIIHRLSTISTDKELIRLGPKCDGGYLVPDDLKGIEACFSPGVSTVSGFEKDCADLGMKVYLADHSVEKPAKSHEQFCFSKKFIGVTTSDDFMTLDDWVEGSLSEQDSDLLLQIDIEGYEYEVFLSASDALMRRFRIIIAEFHGLAQLWNRPFFNLASRVFDKILQTHSCVHIHPNNCCGSIKKAGLEIPRVMEFTFLRSDRIERSSCQSIFPNPLDCDNTRKTTLSLPSCWYRSE